MALCFLHDLPLFVNQDGERLLPGTTWFAGFRKWRPELLRNWLLWRVEEVAGALCLVSLVEPSCTVPLTAELAQEVTSITLSDHFSPARLLAFYELAHLLGYELWAAEESTYGQILLNLRDWSGERWCSLHASTYQVPSASEAAAKLADLFEKMAYQLAEQKRRSTPRLKMPLTEVRSSADCDVIESGRRDQAPTYYRYGLR